MKYAVNGMICRMIAVLLAVCCCFPLLLPGEAQASTDVTRVRAIQGGVSLRTQPYEDAPKIRGVHSDYELEVSDERNGWYYVYYKGDWGWVIGTRVIVIERNGSSGNRTPSVPRKPDSSSPSARKPYSPPRNNAKSTHRPQHNSESFEHFSGFASVAARPNQRLSTRTGPSTRYDEPGTYSQDTQVRAMSKAYDYNNNIWWIQFQMIYRGKVYCLYTGLKRFDGLDIDRLPTEKIIGSCNVNVSAEAYYAPGENGARMSRNVPAYTACDIYAVVSGQNSDWIQIEFWDSGVGQLRRAWIKEWYADNEYFF